MGRDQCSVVLSTPSSSSSSSSTSSSSHRACSHWRILVLLLSFSILSGILILISAKDPTGETNHQNLQNHTIELPPDNPPIKFEYNHEEPSKNLISEYIVLYKLPPPTDPDHHHRFSVNYFNTGNFRTRGSALWDPHPQYIFHAFNIRFHLVLNQNSKRQSLFTPGFKVTTHSHGRDKETYVHRESVRDEDFSACFYTGFVLGDEESSVAVSLCNGMTGHIRTSKGSYFIEPRQLINNDLEHEIYKMAQRSAHRDTFQHPRNASNLQMTSYDYYSDEDYDSEEDEDNKTTDFDEPNTLTSTRSKRSLSTERYVELTVVTDQTMSRYHGDNLKHYVLTLLSIVALVYRDASIGNPMNIVLVNFHVLTDQDFTGTPIVQTNNTTHGTSASEMLRNFCKWQKEHNHPDDRHALHHDTALLLTRETICRNPWAGKCDTLGLAELGTMCDHYASCAIVQDNGLSAAFTIAHELGHVMNMPHDDDYKCNGFVNEERRGGSSSSSSNEMEGSTTGVQHYVMSRMLDHNTYPWAWSRCSRHFLTEFLDAGHGYCLEDKPDSNLLYNDDENSINEGVASSVQQPGEVFSEHKQCEFVFGPNSQLCSYMPPCRRLWCTNHSGPDSEESEGCRTQHMPWADGTRCGANKWCQRGACVLKDLEKLKVVNGGWGEWQDYGECSRTCGGGVRKSYRECDNPKPKNGGKYCVGPRVRYESCNTFECVNGTEDFRAVQCGAYDNDNFNIHGLPDDVIWVPKYNGISPKDRCKLFCRVQGSSSYYLLKEKVIDGTPCGLDTFDVCVNGACLPAGCDRRLHSTKTLDICGTCGGSGSTCSTSQGSYNSTKYGYNVVARIPSGASNIDIRQRSFDNTARDDHYLALFDPISNEYVLNGHFVVSMFRKTIHYGGSILEYSGSDQVLERINSSSRPIKRELEIRVLSVGKLKPPDIVYQYVISTNEVQSNADLPPQVIYAWVGKRSASEQSCSSVCTGVTLPYKTFECVRRSEDSNVVMDPNICSNVSKPPHHASACNTHCRISYKYDCPESCVNARNYTVECIRTLLSTNTTQKISDKYCSNSGVEKGDPPDCVSECRNRKARWRFTQWSECSTGGSGGCGSGNNTVGHQMRNVWCQRWNWRSLLDPTVDNYEVVDDRDCDGEKPSIRRNCRVGRSDAICGEWSVDQWSPCSTTCGPGRTRALYACVLKTSTQTQILPPDYCVHNTKPVVERPCEVVPCGSYDVSNWSSCDCTTNQETRNVTCTVNKTPQPDEQCNRLSIARPEATRNCVSTVCNTEWVVSNWSSDCRLFKSRYYRHRMVSCEKICSGVKPEPMKECGEWKVESEWGACNGSCNVGVETRSVGCYVNNLRVHDKECEGSSVPKPSNERTCFHTCRGDGRMVRGQEGVGGGVENPKFWTNIRSTPAPGTYRWSTGAWNKCTRMTTPKSSSSACVRNPFARVFKKHRLVKCVAETLNPRRVTTVSNVFCDPPAPEASVNCTNSELAELSPCAVWVTGEWSTCIVNDSCPGERSNRTAIINGFKNRNVSCIHDTSDKLVRDSECEVYVPKPEHLEACATKTRVCEYSYGWKVGNWSTCSYNGKKKCGSGGKKTRSVVCVRRSGAEEVPQRDDVCTRKRKRSKKPKETRECVRACPKEKVQKGVAKNNFKWVVQEWSNCSRSCGGYGLRQRRVTCHRTNAYDWTDPEPLPTQMSSQNTTVYCGAPKPKEYDYCLVSESCDNITTYSWASTPFSECGCGNSSSSSMSSYSSFQKRKVYCVNDQSGDKFPARHCQEMSKPKRKRKCECNLYDTCASLRTGLLRNGLPVQDGEYNLTVGGKANVKIYCHGMTDMASAPREYVTVDGQNNWSEVYDKRLIRPDTCPRNGSRLSSCECVQDKNRRVGVTTYTRVRVNVTSLRVDVDDFTFAISTQDLIQYGTAGDCYSSTMNCPQGRFSIDLRGTNFAVSSVTNWVTTGHRATIKVSRKTTAGFAQYIHGVCGGYCASCHVTSLGLRVDVV